MQQMKTNEPKPGIGGVAQVIEHLLCKCETLSSNPSPTAKKKKKRQKQKNLNQITPEYLNQTTEEVKQSSIYFVKLSNGLNTGSSRW
jgi:hypothetical protein